MVKFKEFDFGTAVIFCVVLFGIVLLLTGGFIGLFEKYNELSSRIPESSSEHRQYGEKSKFLDSLEIIFVSADSEEVVDQEKARKDAIDKLDNFIKDKRDLNAQEGMWTAATELLKLTAWHLLFLVLSTVASLCAVYFTYKAFTETKRTNEIASSANRAWCDFIVSDICFQSSQDDVFRSFGFGYLIVNVGRSPAVNVQFHFMVIEMGLVDNFTNNIKMIDEIFDTTGYEYSVMNVMIFHQPAREIMSSEIVHINSLGEPFFGTEARRANFTVGKRIRLNDGYLISRLRYDTLSSPLSASYYKFHKITTSCVDRGIPGVPKLKLSLNEDLEKRIII